MRTLDVAIYRTAGGEDGNNNTPLMFTAPRVSVADQPAATAQAGPTGIILYTCNCSNRQFRTPPSLTAILVSSNPTVHSGTRSQLVGTANLYDRIGLPKALLCIYID